MLWRIKKVAQTLKSDPALAWQELEKASTFAQSRACSRVLPPLLRSPSVFKCGTRSLYKRLFPTVLHAQGKAFSVPELALQLGGGHSSSYALKAPPAPAMERWFSS